VGDMCFLWNPHQFRFLTQSNNIALALPKFKVMKAIEEQRQYGKHYSLKIKAFVFLS
jgi:hypothetical protein